MLQLIERFVKSDIGRRLAAEQRAEDLAARATLVDEVASLQRESGRELARLQAEEARAARAVDVARRDFEAASRRHVEAAAGRRRASLRYDVRIDSIRAELRRTADPQIGTFIRALDRARTVACRAFTVSTTTHWLTGATMVETNAAEIQAQCAAITTAQVAADAMQLEALTAEEITARLEELRDSIPDGRALLLEAGGEPVPAEQSRTALGAIREPAVREEESA
jgi:hypothetical protein